MKNIILLIFIMFVSVSPVFAGNLLQQQDEVRFIQQNYNNLTPINHNKDYLIREDYYCYRNGGETVYGLLLYYMDIAKKQSQTTDFNYLTLCKTKIDTIIKLQNNNVDSNMRRSSIIKKIIIDDNDYKKMTKDVKEFLIMINYMWFE